MSPSPRKTARATTRLTPGDYESAATLRRNLRHFLARTEEITRIHGLTPERYQLLLQVKVAAGEATVGKLATQLSIGQSAATQLVRRAEDLGLLKRSLSPHDARVRFLDLSPEGERRLAAAVAELHDERALLRRLLGEDQTATTP